MKVSFSISHALSHWFGLYIHKQGHKGTSCKNNLLYPLCKPYLPGIHTTHKLQLLVNLSGDLVFCMYNDIILSGASGLSGWKSIQVVQLLLGGDKVIRHLMRSSGSRYFIGALYCRR